MPENTPGRSPGADPDTDQHDAPAHSLKTRLKRMLARIRRHVPPGVRLLLGLVLIGLGFLGFLPVLGFWMIPLGVGVAMLDIAPLWRWLRGR